MHPKALLDAAGELLRLLWRFDAPADSVVSTFFRQHRSLGGRERALVAETAYAAIRRRLLWQHLARGGPGTMERRLAMLAWAGEPALLQRAIEPRESEWLAAAHAFDSADWPEALRHNLPDWLAGSLRNELGDDEFWALVQALEQPAPLDLRVNLQKAKRAEMQRELEGAGIDCTPTPYSPWGLRVAGRPALLGLPAFTRGAFEVQDEGSQLLALLVDAKRDQMVVDFCAGAGGKTLALGAAMHNTGRLYAFDVSGHRLHALKPRLERCGLTNVHPAQITPGRDDRITRLEGKIDRVLVDAPCTGLGTLRRNPDLKWRQSQQAVSAMQAQQSAILERAARLVKSGGRLVYATCSLLRDENEIVTQSFLHLQPGFSLLDAAAVLAPALGRDAQSLVREGMLRLWPHRHGTDGFFGAVFERA